MSDNRQTVKGVPNTRYKCECGETSIAVGWEVQTCVCTECGSVMEWDADLYDPRGL